MALTWCLSCDGKIHIDNPRVGEQITCPECGDMLEVINTDPVGLDYPPDEVEDWDEDDDR